MLSAARWLGGSTRFACEYEAAASLAAVLWTISGTTDRIPADVQSRLLSPRSGPRGLLPHDLRQRALAAPPRRHRAHGRIPAQSARFLHLRSVLLQRPLNPGSWSRRRSSHERRGGLGVTMRRRRAIGDWHRISERFRPPTSLRDFRPFASAPYLITPRSN